MRIVVTGGGTGGHIFPAIAVCEELKRLDPDGEVLYIGGVNGMESTLVPQAGIPYRAVNARKFPSRPSLGTLLGVGSLIRGYMDARKILSDFHPDAIVGTGGYVAAATVLCGCNQKRPAIILENNRIPGRTNLKLASRVRKIGVSFEETIALFDRSKCVVTGMPIRTSIVAPGSLTRQDARERFVPSTPNTLAVLIIGGSQGARAINKIVIEALPEMLARGFLVLHQTGQRNYDEVVEAANQRFEDALVTQEHRNSYVAMPFINAEDMPIAYRAADAIVCRGGISTLSEAAANGLPAIVVPLPTAYADHQTANARALEQVGAALCRPESDVTTSNLMDDLVRICSEGDVRTIMTGASLRWGKPEAATTVARIALEM